MHVHDRGGQLNHVRETLVDLENSSLNLVPDWRLTIVT